MALAESKNFLVPNFTLVICLIIFLIVLAVVWKFVVPPIQKALAERDERVAQTSKDSHAAAQSFEDAEQQYLSAMRDARGEATAIRDEARAKGREELDDMRQRATAEADMALAESDAELKSDGDKAAEQARGEVGSLASTLASRVLGVQVAASDNATSSNGVG
ncbi:F0F1 ATP synthase subunit B [Gordonia jinhuaensis]|uniref:ATP synthase subunit b n=1 Tax=Gordonia jinhuaensis TaxID=1517702 RepID=A0A916WMF1_9ACTN|nr:F0F1 ATP synthase subunit B [Gordonia jinhuaensis]GGB16057.1 ATP synthase subunit b [Gordonia jinhuaensis]